MTKRLAIIDGKSVFYRGYYAMPNLALPDGTPTGGIYGFATLSLELIKKLDPDYVCVAWDKKGTNIRRRREIYPEYKAGRKPAPPDFYAQLPYLFELLEAFSWPLYEFDDYEADDIMGSLARQAEAEGVETCLISSDLDMLQFIGAQTHMYALKKGFSQIELFKPESFEQKYGIEVEQFLDLKSIKGDSSDNIPGVPGIGEKGAVKLLQQYGSLDGIYQHIDEITGATQKKLIAGKESAYMSREIGQIWFDAPIKLDLDAMDVHDLDVARLSAVLKKLQFTSLVRNLPTYMQLLDGDIDEAAINDIKPLDRSDWSDESKTSLIMSDLAMVQLLEDRIYISHDRQSYYEATASQLVAINAPLNILTHDGDGLIKYLLKQGITNLPQIIHDTRQAAFLIDPLTKSRELSDITGLEGADPALVLAALWRVYDEQLASFEQLPGVARVARQIDFPLISLLSQMEYRGIKLDTEFLHEMNQGLSHDIAQIKKQMHDMVGYEFNISSPAQLAEVLFTKLQLPTAGIKKGKTSYSTGQKELDKLRGQHPIIELIEKYRELTKLQNTYVEALPKLVDDQSRLHTTFNQDVAATGRLSSTDPNLQNIPIRTELGRKIRQAFVPESGNVFVSADYSQFELRLAAVLAGDQKMINDFDAGTDIHTKTASEIHGVPLDEVTKNQRRDAKVINFGVLYGMGPHALAQNTGMSFMEAKKFIADYFELRAPIRRYIEATIEKAETEGYVETLFGRRRPTPDIKSSNFVVREAAKRAAANMPIQGTEADLMKMAMLRVEEELPEGAWQVLQIHDSILIECRRDQADMIAEMLKVTMENIYPDLGIKLSVDVSIGENWGEV